MRVTLTIGSSAPDVKPWWSDIGTPANIVTECITLVLREVVRERPRSGVAVTIRVPHPSDTPEQATGAWVQCLRPNAKPAVIHHLR